MSQHEWEGPPCVPRLKNKQNKKSSQRKMVAGYWTLPQSTSQTLMSSLAPPYKTSVMIPVSLVRELRSELANSLA